MKPGTQHDGHDLTNDIVKAVAQQDPKRDAIYKDIENTLGIVPGFFKALPKETLEAEWKIMRDLELSEKTAIPVKYKELIGLAVAAATHCHYCSEFHSAAATMNGASMLEVNEALNMAKNTRGWSAYLNGMRYDMQTFTRELDQIGKHVQSKKGGARV